MTATRDHEPLGTPEQSGPEGIVRLRLDVSYDGSGFHGWARQPGLRSVQADLEGALRTVLRVARATPVRVAVAGRTDAGVHATGQVCHADIPAAAWPSDPEGAGEVVRRRLNGLLAPDVRVRAVSLAPAGFDARWSALWRRYTYQVADAPEAMDPRTRGHVLWHPRGLDLAAMELAGRPLLGEHDFAAFCRARPGASTVRTLHELSWSRSAPAGVCVLNIRADAFCHSMVRSMVGALLAVGDGRWAAQGPGDLLAGARRRPVVTTAAAHGLTLVEVGYPPEPQIAAQVALSRRWRGQ